jgi:hypothetical protein
VVGRRGPIAWPLRLPNLTPMDFFLWTRLEEHLYAVPPRSIEDLAAKLQADVTTLDINMLKACSRERRAAHCRLPSNGRGLLRSKNEAPTV